MRNPRPEEWLTKGYNQNYTADYKPFNFVDGEGIHNSLCVSDRLFACEGCSSKAAQNFRYGKSFTPELGEQVIVDLRSDYVQGLTLLDDKPFLNTDVCLQVVRRIRKEFGTIKDIWSRTGCTLNELLQDSEDKLELPSQIDILVDGRFELSKRDLEL